MRNNGEIVCINMKEVCGFAVSHIRYILLRRIAVLRACMRPIVADRIAWSVGLSVGLSVSHTSEPCKNGWPFGLRTRVRPKNYVLHGVHIPHGKGQFCWIGAPIAKYGHFQP